MVDASCDGMFPFEFTEYYFEPSTIGRWIPIEVVIGFIKDDIKINTFKSDNSQS